MWLFGQKPKWLYLVGFFCVPVAIVIFTLTAPKEVKPDPSASLPERGPTVNGALLGAANCESLPYDSDAPE
jgi:hypothetical protein